MVLGFTGTQQGMTKEQMEAFRFLIRSVDIKAFHHGDCIGADAEAHRIVSDERPECRIIIHPPRIESKRAFCSGDKAMVLAEDEYLTRNKHIVDASKWLVATPKEHHETVRSGTWSTVRYALRQGVPVAVIWPDGSGRRYL